MKKENGIQRGGTQLPIEYVFLIVSGILLLLGFVFFAIVPPEIPIGNYRTPILSFLAALAVTAIGNIIVGFIQKGVSKEAARALQKPISDLDVAVEKLRQIQIFYEAGVIGVFANRSSAMQKFRSELEREDKSIDFVGTSLLGSLDPAEESEEKKQLYHLLKHKLENNVRIRALLMHPAYGEFRERVENRERAAVARDIQRTLKYLAKDILDGKSVESQESPKGGLLDRKNIRLYPGVITAYAIFTSRAMLVNASTLHGPVYDNFTLIIEDTEDPNSIFKKFRANHFEEPWRSEKTVRLDSKYKDKDMLRSLLEIDFAKIENRFKEGDWPPTIPKEPESAMDDDSLQPTPLERDG
ncbi:MAG: hypothetical protein AB1422_08900 [bacterium]